MPDDTPNAPVADPAAAPAAAPRADAPPAPVAGDPPAPEGAPNTEPAKPAAPVEYALTLPNDSGLDPAVVEKTAAIARELGLSPDHAQKTLDFVSQEAAAHAQATRDAVMQSHAPGGAAWTRQQTEWKTAALADPTLGAGKPETLDANVTLAKQVVAKFGSPELAGFLETSGLGSNPDALKLLVNIGKAMKEDQLVLPGAGAGAAARSAAETLYGSTPSA